MDVFDQATRSRVMAAVRGRGNASTELRLVALLRAARITGWRRHARVYGHPDFVFPGARLAIFLDGCFWHACPHHGQIPRTNVTFWRRKLARNQARDRLVGRELRRRGWTVLRFWEHSLKRRPGWVIAKLVRVLAACDA
jgi:DNA mismatch endonuclease (patch repair protein)